MQYKRMPIEIESPEQLGYSTIAYNLSESSYTDAKMGDLKLDLNELLICYGDHLGNPGLRAEILKGEAATLKPNDVLITPGAAGALFIIATSLLEKDDELVVAFPNYATNIETPRAIGAKIKFVEQKFEQGFALDMKALESAITEKTKLVSLTCPHNPTGTMMTEAELREVIALVERHKCWLLVDETYRDMSFKTKLPIAASLSDRVISVSSLSKTYGLPGIRLGWVITRHAKLQELFLAAKEQIFICGSVVDEEIGLRFMQQKEGKLAQVKSDLEHKFAVTKRWMESQDIFEWVEPNGGCVAFPRFKSHVKINLAEFYRDLLASYKTYVGPGHWFEMDDRYFRLGFGWPSVNELEHGLKALSDCAKKWSH